MQKGVKLADEAMLGDYVIDEDLFRPYPGNLLMTGVVSMPAVFTAGWRQGGANPLGG